MNETLILSPRSWTSRNCMMLTIATTSKLIHMMTDNNIVYISI